MDEIKQENTTRNHDSRAILGIVLIVLGGFFLFDSMDIIDVNIGRIIFSFPAVLILVGAVTLMNTNRKLLGGILLGLGIFFMIPRIFPWIYFDKHIVLPILMIAFGIYIILRKRTHKGPDKNFIHSEYNSSSAKDIDTDRVDDVSIFGGGHKVIHSDNFRGGNITAIFGGSEIDLKHCKLAEGKNLIDIVAVFGGSTIIVPGDWNVVIDVLPVFGGFSNKIRRDPGAVIDIDRTLVIKGFVLFGGGEIRS